MTGHARHPSRQALRNVVNDCKFAMFTSCQANGHLHSRTMTMQNTALDADDILWFFMSRRSDPVAERAAESLVNVAYTPPGDACRVSVTGTALVVGGEDKAKSLWSSWADVWISCGPTEPDLAVVQLHIVHVSAWQAGDDAGSRPALRGGDVGFRAPDHRPRDTAPVSENVALLFERS